MKISVLGDPAIYAMMLRDVNGYWARITMNDERVFDRVYLSSSSADLYAEILSGEMESGNAFSEAFRDIAAVEVL